ncbi:MAG: efflux RND transporter periplasmic adaptor subunit [Betaproteobacteria bacterium]|nr:efflux RND transporter periplasmic adaptor subunit [Betaproteobacteria bacterium]
MKPRPGPRTPWFARPFAACALAVVALLVAGCGKEAKQEVVAAPVEVTALTIVPRDVPIATTFVAQTQSSQAVNIQARVSGFLDKRVYTEGSVVRAGQVLFRMDPKPFQAQVDGAAAALQKNQAAHEVAKANLARIKPLAQLNALSQKDLDDAQGQFEQTAAAVAQSQAQLESARLDLSYTTITSPVAGVSSFSAVAEGSYVDAKNAQLTTVSVLTPMWINFSLSENEMERLRSQVQKGLIRMPAGQQFVVEVELVDGSVLPDKGRITFADPSYNSQTGTFLIRASVDNPKGVLRPNQYVRARLLGATRPNAVLVPQRAVQQGAKGHFVWVANKADKAELRPVQVGDWYGDSWFIAQGLAAGDRVVVDGTLRLAPDAPVKVAPYVPKADSPEAAPATRPEGATLAVSFATGKATLDAEALRLLKGFAPAMKAGVNPIDVTGFADRTGNRSANAELAKRRAMAVRDALIAEGVPADRVRLKAPQEVTGSGSDRDARRVEIAVGQ